MRNTVETSGLPEEDSRAGRAGPAPDSEQTARDTEEKKKHRASENALESSQDKNPVPPGSTAD
jgi:hypothetical protein